MPRLKALLAPLLMTAAVLMSAAALPRPSFALTLETPLTNPDGTPNFADDKNPKYDRFRNNLSGQNGDESNDGRPAGLTFGSPDNGGSLTFSVGPADRADPFNNDRFFRRLGPPSRY